MFPVIAVWLTLAGCHASAPTFAERLVPNASFVDAPFDVAWTAASDVLKSRRFILDEADPGTGILKTFPLTSPHFFEFWVDQPPSARDRAEASLSHIRRWVTVEISRPVGEHGCRVVVTVRKERRSTPERQVTNSAAVVFFLSRSLPTTISGESVATGDTWIDLGRDPGTENQIRQAIVKEIARKNR